MALTIFPTGDEYIPSVGLGYAKIFRHLKADFGEGYEQITADGANAVMEKWPILWRDIPTATATTIKDFLDLRGVSEAFYWTPPTGTQIKVRMRNSYKENFSKTLNVSTLSVTFEQVFDL